MPTLMRRLKISALESAHWRGHAMSHFHRVDDPFWRSSDNLRTSECQVCGAQIVVNTHPMPNEIDTSGEAVALNCPAKESQ